MQIQLKICYEELLYRNCISMTVHFVIVITLAWKFFRVSFTFSSRRHQLSVRISSANEKQEFFSSDNLEKCARNTFVFLWLKNQYDFSHKNFPIVFQPANRMSFLQKYFTCIQDESILYFPETRFGWSTSGDAMYNVVFFSTCYELFIVGNKCVTTSVVINRIIDVWS